MTDEEREKMWKDISKMIDDQLKQQIQRQIFMQGNFGLSNSVSWSHGTSTGNISPTDKDAKGRYSYQEPEQDEQGTYYGYKVLVMCHCGCGELHSPRYPAAWRDGELHADQEPSENTLYGIHFAKRMDNPALNDYAKSSLSVLVQCALSGTVVETEQGFRAEHALIVGVYTNGNWESYQDYKERATTNSHRNPWNEKNWWNSDDYDPRTTFTWDTSPTSKKGKGGNLLP